MRRIVPCDHRLAEAAMTRTADDIPVHVFRCELMGYCVGYAPSVPRGGVPLPICAECPDRREPENSDEPMGDILHDLLATWGIHREECPLCRSMRSVMNEWGLNGCKRHRAVILRHLRRKARTATLWECWQVVRRGYFTAGSILRELYRRGERWGT